MKRFLPILCIFFVWLIFSVPYFFKGFVPFPSDYLVSFFPPWSASYGMPVKNNAMPDVITQIYPWKTITIDALKNGQIPLWNPYSFSGTVHAANYQAAAFSPFNLLFFLFNHIDAWTMLILLQPLLAGFCMYFFLRTIHRSSWASTYGALSFMFCGFLVVWMAYGTLGYAALWLPLIYGGIAKFFKRHTWWSNGAISFGIALSLVSGHFQISLYVIGASILFILHQGILSRDWKKMGMTGMLVGIGILLAAPQLLISFDAYGQSVRSSSFIKGEVIPWNYLITLFSPDFFGNPVTRNDWFGHYAEWSGFIGVVGLLLSLYTLVRKKDALVWFFISLCALAFSLALPTPLNDLLFRIRVPVLSTSAASRIIILVSFSLATLSAFGLDGLLQDWEKKKIKTYTWFGIGVGLILVCFWIVPIFGQILPADKLLIAQRNSMLPSMIVLVGLVAGLLGFLRKGKVVLFSLILLLVLTAFDLLRFATKWMPNGTKTHMYPQVNVLKFLQKNVSIDRVFGNLGGEVQGFGILGIEGYDALYQARYGSFIAAATAGNLATSERSVVMLGKKAQYAQRVLDLLGVRFIAHRLSDGRNVWAYPHWEHPGYVSVYKDEHYEVLENTRAFPRFFLASAYQIPQTEDEYITTLLDEQFDAQKTLLLEKTPSIDPQEGEGSVTLSKYTSNELIFSVTASSPKLFFLSDTYDPGWKASIDGTLTEVYRAHYDFRAVAVPAGTHTVRLYYEPQSVKIGMGIASIALLAFIIGTLRLIFYEHRHL